MRLKLEREAADWNYPKKLPRELCGFAVRSVMSEDGDRYNLFACECDEKKICVSAYFHEETGEYKIRLRVGMIELVRLEFMAADLARFEELLSVHLEPLLRRLADFSFAADDSLILAKGIFDWEYGKRLPRELDGFSLFIAPDKPLPVGNESYVIINYVDFAAASDFIIYYNALRDEFFGESHIAGTIAVSYDFDARTLDALAEKLDENLLPHLKKIRMKTKTAKNL